MLLPVEAEARRAAVRAWTELLAGTGQVGFAIPIDEPRRLARKLEVRALAAEVRAAGGGPGRFLYAVTDEPHFVYGDLIDAYLSPYAVTRDGARAVAGAMPERWTYNGGEPFAGPMVLDSGGPALRTWGWIAWRWQVGLWYVWDVMYWSDRYAHRRRGGTGLPALTATDTDAVTFDDGEDHGNLDGVLLHPGPAGSWRLKTLRRGLQDRALLDALAACAGREAADAIAAAIVPRALGDAGAAGSWRRGAWPRDEAAVGDRAARGARRAGRVRGRAMSATKPPAPPASPEPPEADARLGALAGAVVDAVTHRRKLPVVRAADALALTDQLHGAMDRAMVQHAESAAVEGLTIACGDCHACCESVVITYEGDALRIAAYLQSADGAAARAHFVASYPAWRARLGRQLEVIAHPPPGGFHDALAAAHRERVPCAFLRDGRCSVYPVRPLTCRSAHALDTDAHCGGDHTEEPKVWAWAPLMEYIEHTRPLLIGVHHALRGAAPPEPVCVAVNRLLGGDATPARNEPCPCGSGKKYKKCCGAAA